jgi:hypothetical protein
MAALRAFATGQGPAWPYQSNSVDEYIATVDQAAPNNASDLKLALYRYYVIWLAQNSASGSRRIGFGSIALVVAGLIIAGFLLYGVFDPKFVNSLAIPGNARGLVTFLFAFATTSVIVVVTIGVLWVPKDEIESRFSKAKDIMTILISVLGTILGFYFGQAQNTPPNPERQTATVAAPASPIARPAPTAGETSPPTAPANGQGRTEAPDGAAPQPEKSL